jgi:hypothetical protein
VDDEMNQSTLDQVFNNRLDLFRKTRLDDRNACFQFDTAIQAAMLMGDLLDAYGSLSAITEAFAWKALSPMESGLFGLVMYSIAIEHERLDEFLHVVHEDLCCPQGAYFFKGRLAHIARYFTSTLSFDGFARSQVMLWDADGDLLHDPASMISTYEQGITDQLAYFFRRNDSSIINVLADLENYAESPRQSILSKVLGLIADSHLALNDPRRLKILPLTPNVSVEIQMRLSNILHWLDHQMDENERLRQMSACFELFNNLSTYLKHRNMHDIIQRFSQMVSEDNPHSGYAEIVIAHSNLMKIAIEKGLDVDRMMCELFNVEARDKPALIRTLAADLPKKRYDRYEKQDTVDVLKASYLLLQDAETLASSGCTADELLSLYLLTAEEHLREVVKNSDHPEAMLAYDLGI